MMAIWKYDRIVGVAVLESMRGGWGWVECLEGGYEMFFLMSKVLAGLYSDVFEKV